MQSLKKKETIVSFFFLAYRWLALSDPDRLVTAETMYEGDHALLYIAYVMLIWATLIPATRWHCSM